MWVLIIFLHQFLFGGGASAAVPRPSPPPPAPFRCSDAYYNCSDHGTCIIVQNASDRCYCDVGYITVNTVNVYCNYQQLLQTTATMYQGMTGYAGGGRYYLGYYYMGIAQTAMFAIIVSGVVQVCTHRGLIIGVGASANLWTLLFQQRRPQQGLNLVMGVVGTVLWNLYSIILFLCCFATPIWWITDGVRISSGYVPDANGVALF